MSAGFTVGWRAREKEKEQSEMTESEMENCEMVGKKGERSTSRKKHVICQRDEVYVCGEEKGKSKFIGLFIRLHHSFSLFSVQPQF